jgi:carbonic anhydrase
VLIEVGEHNAEFQKIIHSLNHIALKGQVADLKEALDYKALFPANTTDYWTYQGSLTTPPCTECVQWVVYKQPIQVSQQQVI